MAPECNACGGPLDAACDHCCRACLGGNECPACAPTQAAKDLHDALSASTPADLRHNPLVGAAQAHLAEVLNEARRLVEDRRYQLARREAALEIVRTLPGRSFRVWHDAEREAAHARIHAHHANVARCVLLWAVGLWSRELRDGRMWHGSGRDEARRIERKRKGARLRALRAIYRDADRWHRVVWAARRGPGWHEHADVWASARAADAASGAVRDAAAAVSS